MKEELNNCETTTLSSDAWTDPRSKAYLANSSSLIDAHWSYKQFLLGCSRMKGRHTASNIFSKYSEITNRFRVNDKVTDNVTDAAAK